MAADEGCQHILGVWEAEEEAVSHMAAWGRQEAWCLQMGSLWEGEKLAKLQGRAKLQMGLTEPPWEHSPRGHWSRHSLPILTGDLICSVENLHQHMRNCGGWVWSAELKLWGLNGTLDTKRLSSRSFSSSCLPTTWQASTPLILSWRLKNPFL